MSAANWNQIEIAEGFSKAFQDRQPLTNKEDDAWLWSKAPMQQHRSQIDAQAYLVEFFSKICEYLEQKHHIHILII
jgi:hypothetical protein